VHLDVMPQVMAEKKKKNIHIGKKNKKIIE